MNTEKQKKHIAKIGIVVACLAIVVVGGVWLFRVFAQQTKVPSSNSNSTENADYSGGISANNSDVDIIVATGEEASAIEISLSDIIVNADMEMFHWDYSRYDYDNDKEEIWSAEELTVYYGRELEPPYIPENLTAATSNDGNPVWVRPDGTLSEDLVILDYVEKSGTLTPENSIHMEISKLGIVGTTLYLADSKMEELTFIENVGVNFGCMAQPYGPRDEETDEPAGYYEVYIAHFECCGIEYMIVGRETGLEELVKVVASIIYDEEEIVIEK